jgi:ABC-type transporter MlaC component
MLSVIAIAASALIAAVPARAQDEEVDDFVATLDAIVQSIDAQDDDGTAREIARCRELVSRILEIETMARIAIGVTWERMSTQQKAAYRGAFETRMASLCVRSMRAFRSQKVILAGTRPTSNGERMVTTNFLLKNNGERLVTWRLRGRTAVPPNTPLRAHDVIADGSSAVATARSEFSAVLESNNGNIDALIASMQR